MNTNGSRRGSRSPWRYCSRCGRRRHKLDLTYSRWTGRYYCSFASRSIIECDRLSRLTPQRAGEQGELFEV